MEQVCLPTRCWRVKERVRAFVYLLDDLPRALVVRFLVLRTEVVQCGHVEVCDVSLHKQTTVSIIHHTSYMQLITGV